MEYVNRLFRRAIKRETLSDQVFNSVTRKGWPSDAAVTCATTAVEICGSDEAVNAHDLGAVLGEVMRVG